MSDEVRTKFFTGEVSGIPPGGRMEAEIQAENQRLREVLSRCERFLTMILSYRFAGQLNADKWHRLNDARRMLGIEEAPTPSHYLIDTQEESG